ncbi:hypothetical protein ACFLZ7_02290 [Nanoarchaeota archaeon]
MVDDYALVSEKEVGQLKRDVDFLKKNPLGGTSSGKSLQDDITNLDKSIKDLVGIFKNASDQMSLEDKETDIIAKKIDPLFEKIDLLIDQNQKIAKGIVAVADLVSDTLQKQAPQPRPQVQRTAPSMPSRPGPMGPSGLPPLGAPGSFPPPPGARPASSGGLPPLAPPKKESKGLFGGFLSK